jgi:outer membrane protein
MISSWAARAGLFSFAMAVATAVFPQDASAQVKMGVVDMRRAILETAELKKASTDLEAKYKPRQDEGARLTKQLQDIQQQMQAGQGKLTQQQETDLQAQGTRRQRELQRLSDDLQADIERDRNEVLGKAQANMQAVVKKLAEDKGLDVVVDTGNTIYYKTAMDITNEAITAYNAAHPVK